MKVTLAALLLATLGAGIEGAEPEPQFAVRVETAVVLVPFTEARRLVPQLRNTDTFAAARARVQSLLEDGDAELLDFAVDNQLAHEVDISIDPPWYRAQFLHSASSRFGAESVEGIECSTEMEPPHPPQPIEYNMWDFRREPSISSIMNPPAICVPVNFYTRSAGTMLGVETNVDSTDGQISLAVSVRYSKLLGIEAPIGARSDRIGDRKLSHPRFRDLQAESLLHFSNSVDRLIGVFREEAPKSGFMLILLSAQAERLPRTP